MQIPEKHGNSTLQYSALLIDTFKGWEAEERRQLLFSIKSRADGLGERWLQSRITCESRTDL